METRKGIVDFLNEIKKEPKTKDYLTKRFGNKFDFLDATALQRNYSWLDGEGKSHITLEGDEFLASVKRDEIQRELMKVQRSQSITNKVLAAITFGMFFIALFNFLAFAFTVKPLVFYTNMEGQEYYEGVCFKTLKTGLEYHYSIKFLNQGGIPTLTKIFIEGKNISVALENHKFDESDSTSLNLPSYRYQADAWDLKVNLKTNYTTANGGSYRIWYEYKGLLNSIFSFGSKKASLPLCNYNLTSDGLVLLRND